MKKNIIYLFIGIIISVSLTWSIYLFGERQLNTGSIINRISTKIFDYNTIEVKCVNKQFKKDITIYYGNDCIYENGYTHYGIDNKYGWNCFDIYYQGKKKFTVCHFKKNNWHVNNYNFDINYFTDSMDVSLEIDGPDSSERLYYKSIKHIDDKIFQYYYDRNKHIYKIDTIK